MKKRDIIVAAVVLTAALLFWLAGQLTKREPEVLRITVAGEVYGTYSLKENQKISIQDTNVCQIQDGYVTMTEADCPDRDLRTYCPDLRGWGFYRVPSQ